MSVLVKKRKKSKFEVFDHWYNLRKELTDLLLRDFGYSSLMNGLLKMKKLAPQMTLKDFTNWFFSWFNNHKKLMSKLQKKHLLTLFKEVSELCLS